MKKSLNFGNDDLGEEILVARGDNVAEANTRKKEIRFRHRQRVGGGAL